MEAAQKVCCSVYPHELPADWVKMAKNQNMTLNLQISGLCGKLKCCLAYEKEIECKPFRQSSQAGRRFSSSRGGDRRQHQYINQTFVPSFTSAIYRVRLLIY